MLNTIIDLSHFNQISSFANIKASGIQAVFYKATQGVGYTDPTFAAQTTSAKQAGLLVGAYHFGVGGDVIAQADHFMSIAGNDKLLVLDFEQNTQGATMSLAEAENFVQHVQQVTGKFPGLYTGSSFIKATLNAAGVTAPEQTILSKCWLWIAEYGPAAQVPPIWNSWTFWQYTEGGTGIDGITGKCDRDYFNGTDDELNSIFSV